MANLKEIGREYVTLVIDGPQTTRFEAFLDRNFPGWRGREILKAKNAETIRRKWYVGIDDVERNALFRRQYVEIYDEFIDLDESGEAVIHYPKNILCDIDGDLTPVAVWKRDGRADSLGGPEPLN